uniref:Pentraxin (PTX) domain-containing protein n=1 Tax=Cyprinodon variegatus TaxID=28743 RepID=A0A3Q2CN71_CYPVA
MVFREQTSSSYVEIVPSKPFNLKAFQLCRKVAINMWRESNGRVNFYVPELWLQQTHLCFTWDSATGATPVFVNGGRSLIKILKKGHRIRPGGRAILDQKPNCFLGTFNSQQSFVGDILDFNIIIIKINNILTLLISHWRNVPVLLTHPLGEQCGVKGLAQRPRVAVCGIAARTQNLRIASSMP